MKNNELTRRHFLTLASKGVGVAIVSQGILGASLAHGQSGEGSSALTPATFDCGVASGDPTPNAVILWTRLSPIDVSYAASLPISWEVATDKAFTHLITRGTSSVNSQSDYTIKIDAVGLTPGSTYYYRFTSGNTLSPIGQTKTLPTENVDKVKLAVVSCSNYPAGFFNAYDLASKQNDVDAVLHLGDYIYEYGSDGYATEHAAELGREVLPKGELLSLSDYRTRYAQYRTDKSLQKLHRLAPFICVWDDHEVANDTYKGGAENHQDNEGSYDRRKLDALQAYFEWMPIRPVVKGNNEIINRSFKFGKLVDLFMLDTRIVGRDKQLDYANYIDKSTGLLDAPRFSQDVNNKTRTMLGADQKDWLLNEFTQSNGKWQVLGQQVLMGRMMLPAAVVTRQMSMSQYAELAPLAVLGGRVKKQDSSLTQNEITYFNENSKKLTPKVVSLLQLPNIPYNLDAWDGYAAERETLLQAIKQLNKNVVVLAGDTHNAWANNLRTEEGDLVAVEFGTPSISSPGLESYLKLSEDKVIPTETGLIQIIRDLQYMNVSNRGFITVTFTEEKVSSEWHFVDTILSTSYTELKGRGKTIESMAQKPELKLM